MLVAEVYRRHDVHVEPVHRPQAAERPALDQRRDLERPRQSNIGVAGVTRVPCCQFTSMRFRTACVYPSTRGKRISRSVSRNRLARLVLDRIDRTTQFTGFDLTAHLGFFSPQVEGRPPVVHPHFQRLDLSEVAPSPPIVGETFIWR